MSAQTPPSVLLFGCGKIGTHLGNALVRSRHRVFAVRRRIETLPAAFTGIALDYCRPGDVDLPAVDSVVITLTPGSPRTDPVDLVSPLCWLVSALPTPPRRVILVSSTGVFAGAPGERVITESDAPQPTTVRAQALLDSELAARGLFGASVIRPAGIYGPGREHLIRQVAGGVAIDHQRRTNRVHETDLVRALYKLLQVSTPPTTLHAVDDEPATRGEVARHIARRLNVPVPPALPTGPSGYTISGAAFKAFLGDLRYPDYRTGYDEIIERDHGLSMPGDDRIADR